jgi:uncharacterized protein involved in outer membrane biogenesis
VGATAVTVTLLRLDAIARQAIERHGSAIAHTAVTVDSVHIALASGTAVVRGLTIANPPGFGAPHAFELDEITVQMTLSSVLIGPLVVRNIDVRAPRVTCELDANGRSNIEQIRKSAEHSARRAEHGASERPAAAEPSPPSGRRLIIDRLALQDGEIRIDARAVGGPDEREALPGFELTDIGRKRGGATPAEVGRIVITAIARDVAVAVAATQLERFVGHEIGGPAGDLLKKGGAEALRKGLGNLVDQFLPRKK